MQSTCKDIKNIPNPVLFIKIIFLLALKILKTSTKVVQAGFAIKGIVDIVLHPLKSIRDIAKKILIKAIVIIVKKVINLTMKNKTDEDSHIVIKQLNALMYENNLDKAKEISKELQDAMISLRKKYIQIKEGINFILNAKYPKDRKSVV